MFFFLTVVLILFSIWIGTVLGRLRRRNPDYKTEASTSTIVTSMLGLVAFMLAFTFGITAQSFQTRRQLFLDEVNAIGTTYLRTGLILEPQRSLIRRLLKEYVDIRADIAKTTMQNEEINLQEAASRSESLQDQIWSHAEALPETRITPLEHLFIDSLNQMIDLHTSRATVFQYCIPPTAWYILIFITILSMAMVRYQAGLSGKKTMKVGTILAMAFSAVIFLVADLDRAAEGRFRINQKPMIDLQKKIQMLSEKTGQLEKLETR